MTERRNSRRTHLVYPMTARCHWSVFWQRGARAEGSTKHVTHIDKFSISSDSSGKRSECHCRWSSSIQWAETGRSAEGQLHGPRHASHATVFVADVPRLQALAAFRAAYYCDYAHLEETQKDAEKTKVNKWEKGKESPLLPARPFWKWE